MQIWDAAFSLRLQSLYQEMLIENEIFERLADRNQLTEQDIENMAGAHETNEQETATRRYHQSIAE